MLSKFPLEIVERISSYCEVQDIINASCCSKEYQTLFESILWQHVQIPLLKLTESCLPDSAFKNMHHTTSLTLYHKKHAKELHFGYNLAKLLHHIVPSKLVMLHLHESMPSGSTFIILMEELGFLQELELDNVSLKNKWSDAICGISLKCLILHNCDITDVKIKELLERNKLLKKLELKQCPHLSNQCLEIISVVVSTLTDFRFNCSVDPIDIDDHSEVLSIRGLA